jgi:hypothetical protein
MPALTTGIANIESARALGGTWACVHLAPFRSLLRSESGHDQESAAIQRSRHVPDQDVPQRSTSPVRYLDIIAAWEQSAGNQVPCRALKNTVKWFQLWAALAACFLILLM